MSMEKSMQMCRKLKKSLQLAIIQLENDFHKKLKEEL